MKRSPRRLERQVHAAATAAPWLTDVDLPAVTAAKTLARKLDERIAAAEGEAGSTLFDNGPALALADMTGGFTYDLESLSRMLSALGLTPAGRANLAIEPDVGDDALAAVVNLDLEVGPAN